jgi:hypothetical protein
MMRRCNVKNEEKIGMFLKNGQSRKKRLNRAISDASWGDLILNIEYLAAKQGKVVIKVSPKYSSQECRNCGYIDKSYQFRCYRNDGEWGVGSRESGNVELLTLALSFPCNRKRYQIEMVKNSSVLNVDITNTLILARQKPSEIEMRK